MSNSLVIAAAGLIDGNGAEIRRNVFLAIEDGVIAAIGSQTDLPCHSAVDDYPHCIVLPALVDCSVALSRSPAMDAKGRPIAAAQDSADKRTMFERHILYCHGHGVLGAAASDDVADLLAHLPGTLAAEFHIRTSEGLCRSIEDADIKQRDFIRVDYSGDIDEQESGATRLAHRDLCDILKKKGRKKTVVVANGAQRVAEAIAAGCDAVEQGYAMGEDNLKAMAERDILWIPNVLRARNAQDGAGGGDAGCRFSQRAAVPGKREPEREAFWQKMLAGQLSQLRRAAELGVPIAVGTGAGSAGILHGESMIEEMKLFRKAGMSLGQTIRSASENGARFFGMQGLGALAVGRPATFLIVRGTAQQLPRKLSSLDALFINGAPSAIYRKTPTRAAR